MQHGYHRLHEVAHTIGSAIIAVLPGCAHPGQNPGAPGARKHPVRVRHAPEHRRQQIFGRRTPAAPVEHPGGTWCSGASRVRGCAGASRVRAGCFSGARGVRREEARKSAKKQMILQIFLYCFLSLLALIGCGSHVVYLKA